MKDFAVQLNELSECYNLIKHLGKRLGLETSDPVIAGSVVNHSRSVLTLKNKISALTQGNMALSMQMQRGGLALDTVVHFVAKVGSRFTEDSQDILTADQRKVLANSYTDLRDGVLHCGGYLAFNLESVESEEFTKEFYADKQPFIDLAKSAYTLINEQEEKDTKVSAEGDTSRPLYSVREAQESMLLGDTDKVILGSAPKISEDPLE